ncbi:MAG: polyphosphate kinase 1 [Saprospiraceae bacterium]
MKTQYPLKNRDITWLSFNYRVLQEAKDKRNPLFERIKFLAIYSSNLGEFFRVRVAATRSLIKLKKKSQKALDFKPSTILRKMRSEINNQQIEFSRIYNEEILPELAKHGIIVRRNTDLTPDQKAFVESYYHQNKSVFGHPVLISKQIIRPSLRDAALYLAAKLKDDGSDDERYAIFFVPSEFLPRFIELPNKNPDVHEIILLDDIVRHTIPSRIQDYEFDSAYSFKLTRDADLYIDDEFSGNLVEKIKTGLAKRKVGPAARFVYDRKMPNSMLKFLKECWNLEDVDLFPEGHIHNNFDFFGFPNFGKSHLELQPLPLLPLSSMKEHNSIFEAIEEKDHLIHVPYHTYESVIQLFEQAADDPKVTSIKIVQYRVAKSSRIMNALIRAAKAGKKVMAFVEIKARFDEEANLIWADRLKRAGVKVIYSFPGLKVHAKLALVTRKDENIKKQYAYMATGNFHEKTAKIYSDLGVFTSNITLISEIENVFAYLETQKPPKKSFKHLWVGQFNLREDLTKHIESEISNAKKGKKAYILLKVNSLEDEQIIYKLYEASIAGVKIDLIIRGICRLVPGLPGISHNIKIISIVDRYLEHARVFSFYNKGNLVTYLSSADTMERNLSRRIEVAFPVIDEQIKKTIQDLMEIQLSDNVKTRIIDEKHRNKYIKPKGNTLIQSQLVTHQYIKDNC